MFFSVSPSPDRPPSLGHQHHQHQQQMLNGGFGGGLPPVVEKCICELCECGDHRCPHAGTLGVSQERFAYHQLGPTEYGQAFVAKEGLPAVPFRRPISESAPPLLDTTAARAMDLESTHQHDFRPWIMSAPVIARPDLELQRLLRPNEPFTAQSTHQADFDVKPIPEENFYSSSAHKGRHPSAEASDYHRPPGAPFNAETVHQLDFGPKPLNPAKPFRPPEAEHRRFAAAADKLPPMEAETTHSHDFRRFEAPEAAKPFRPPSGSRHFTTAAGEGETRQPFEDQTEHRANFGQKPLVVAAPATTSFRPKSQQWRPSSQPMDATSTYQQGFVEHKNVERPQAFRPQSETGNRTTTTRTHGGGSSFAAVRSTNHADFGPKPAPPERMCPAERVLTRRDKNGYQFVGVRAGHRFYRRFLQAQRPEPTQRMRLAPVQG